MTDGPPTDPTPSWRTTLARVWEDIRIALIFLTRLPVSYHGDMPRVRITQAMGAFPVAGGVVGALGGTAYALAFWAGLGPMAAGVLALMAMIAATGAFHEDGLGDVADGFGGGHTREAKLTIMRDSRLGTYGTVAIVLALLLKLALLIRIEAPWLVFASLIATGTLSRAMIVAVIYWVSPARGDGQSAEAGRPPGTALKQVLAIGLIAALIALPVGTALAAILAACLGAWGVSHLARRQIGGQTGDVLGATQMISELAALTAIAALTV